MYLYSEGGFFRAVLQKSFKILISRGTTELITHFASVLLTESGRLELWLSRPELKSKSSSYVVASWSKVRDLQNGGHNFLYCPVKRQVAGLSMCF